MDAITSFLKGYKPAVLVKGAIIETLKDYSRVPDIHVFDPITPHVLYFQTEQAKELFLRSINNRLSNTPLFHRQLGLALGYAPKAVEFFVTATKNEKKKHFLSYCGISFVGNIDDLEENITWLWENICAPYITEIGYPTGNEHYDTFQIGYLDYSAVQNISCYFRKQEKGIVL